MGLAFWRQASTEEQAAKAMRRLDALPPEVRDLVITGEGFFTGTPPGGDWVTNGPSLADSQSRVSSAFTSTVAVYACVALIAESIASLPCLTYRKLSDDERERVPENNSSPGPGGWMQRLARMMHSAPNPEMTAQEFWETVLGHLLLWGNAYVNVVRSNGRPIELWPLRPDCMTLERDDKKIRRYRYTLPATGQYVILSPNEVMHVRAMSLDGVEGVSPIGVARSAVEITRAAEEFVRGFYRDGVQLPGILKTDAPLTGPPERQNEQLDLIQQRFHELHGGLRNAHRVAVLSNVSWQNVGMPLDDAQFLETRRFQLNDIARLYRIPPHMVGDVERSTSWGTGIEQQGIGFVVYTLRPWIERLEQASNRDLGFPGKSILLDEGVFSEFEVDGLLRGDTKSRYEGYAILLDKQVIVPNDVRRKENWPPVEWGDEPIKPAGTGGSPAADVPNPPSLEPVSEAASNGHSLTDEPAWWR